MNINCEMCFFFLFLIQDSNSNKVDDANDIKATPNSPIVCPATDEQNGTKQTEVNVKNGCNNNTGKPSSATNKEKMTSCDLTLLQTTPTTTKPPGDVKGTTTTTTIPMSTSNKDHHDQIVGDQIENNHYKSDLKLTNGVSYLQKYKHVIAEVNGNNGVSGGIIGNGLKNLNKITFGEKNYDSDEENIVDSEKLLTKSTKTLSISSAKPTIAKC